MGKISEGEGRERSLILFPDYWTSAERRDTWTITRRRIPQDLRREPRLYSRSRGVVVGGGRAQYRNLYGGGFPVGEEGCLAVGGGRERQSSLLDEFFLFSRRSFKNGRLACKSARDLVSSSGFISITFFPPSPGTRSHPRVILPSLSVSRLHTFARRFRRILHSPPSIARIISYGAWDLFFFFFNKFFLHVCNLMNNKEKKSLFPIVFF